MNKFVSTSGASRLIVSLFIVLSLLVVPAASGLATPATAAPATAVMDPHLLSAVASGTGSFQVIVTFHGEGAPGNAEQAVLRDLGITRGVLFKSLPIAGVVATAEQVNALAHRPEVRSLWRNTPLQYEEMTSRNGGMPVAGHGVTVLVNDSGIDGLHGDLRSRMAQNVAGQLNLNSISGLLPATYVEGLNHTDVGGGHGTHVAGIVAGTGARSNGAYEGVAPGATLVGYGSGAGLALLDTLGGFDYALQNRDRYNIRVITNSWGDTSDTGDFNPDHPINVASKMLDDRGVVVVFSAGNAGPGAGTISGNYKKAPWVITVAAGDKNRALANFSSRGVRDRTVTVTGSDGRTYVSEDRPTVTAPGVAIVSARASGSSLTPLSALDDLFGIPLTRLADYTILSGTSMAAPHVAGIVALMLDANPSLTPAQIKAIIEDSADLMDGYEAWEVGAGYVNAYDAVATAFAPAQDGAANKGKKCNNKNRDRNPHCATPASRVTVAVIDSAINPYHDFFHAGGEPYTERAPSSVTPEVLAAFGIGESQILDLTRTGDFQADYQADKSRIWDNIQTGQPYWIRGTNIIAVSFVPGTRPVLPDDANDTHGVGTSAAVLRANPDAIVLFIEGINDDAEAYAFNHPEVDIVSTSYGPIGSIPLPYHIHNSYVGVVKKGKLHFGAADNSPSTAMQDSTAGPWWSIGIAGFQEESTEGRQILSGSFADFVGDFTQRLPYCHDCQSEYRASVSGTSFATPRSAGTMSKILLEARRALGHTGGIVEVNGIPVVAQGQGVTLTNWELRRALEEAAYFPSVYDYSAGGGTYDLTSLPVLDPAPWAQVGWGVITPAAEHNVIEQTLAHLGIRGEITRTKDALACQFMTALIETRQLYWNNVALGSESWLEPYNPYIYCGQ